MRKKMGFGVWRVLTCWLVAMTISMLLASWVQNDYIATAIAVPTWGGPYLLMYIMSANAHRPNPGWFIVGTIIHLTLWMMIGCYWGLITDWFKKMAKKVSDSL